MLLIHYKQLDMWLPVGGHIEKNEILLAAEYCEFGPTDVSIIISTRQTEKQFPMTGKYSPL